MPSIIRLLRKFCTVALLLAVASIDVAGQSTAPDMVRLRIFRRDRPRQVHKGDRNRGTATVWDGDTKLGELKPGSHEFVVQHTPGILRLRILFQDDPESDTDGWLVVCTHPTCEVEVPSVDVIAQSMIGALDSTVLSVPAVAEEVARLRLAGASSRARAVELLNKLIPPSPDCGSEYTTSCEFGVRFSLEDESPFAIWNWRSTSPIIVPRDAQPGARVPAKTEFRGYRIRLDGETVVFLATYYYSDYWSRKSDSSYRGNTHLKVSWQPGVNPMVWRDGSIPFNLKLETVEDLARLLATLWVFLSPAQTSSPDALCRAKPCAIPG